MTPITHFPESDHPDHLQLNNSINAKLPGETEEDFEKRRHLLYRRRSYHKQQFLKKQEESRKPKVAAPPIVTRSRRAIVDNDIQNVLAKLGKQHFKLNKIEKWSAIFLKEKFVRVVVVPHLVHREAPFFLTEKGDRRDIFDITKGNPEDKAGLVAEVNRVFQVQVYEPGRANSWSNLFRIQLSQVGNRPGLRNKAGYGLYADRPLKAAETIGWYLGHTRKVKKFTKKVPPSQTEYAIRFVAQDGGKFIVDAGRAPKPKVDKRLPVYFGIQFANDPNWGKSKTERNRRDPRYNASINRHLEVIAMNDIDIGEEIFLDYEGDECSDDEDTDDDAD
jgi:hypothetical protein